MDAALTLKGQLCPNPNCGETNSPFATTCASCGVEQRQLLGRGVVLRERYRIEAVCGCGGFGAVYRATDLLTGEWVAVKENRHHRTFARFAREAQLLLTIHHPHLPKVREAFVEEEIGRAYLVMTYVPGETLEHWVQRQGRLSWAEANRLFEPLVDAIAYLHERGIVHRDIKPANILLVPPPQPPTFPSPSQALIKRYAPAQSFRQGRQWAQELLKGCGGKRLTNLWYWANRLTGTWEEEPQPFPLWVAVGEGALEEWHCPCLEGQRKRLCSHLVALLLLYRERPSLFQPAPAFPQPPVALVDFGIAKVLEPADPHRPHSSTLVAWTDGFSPPEQYRRDVEPDPRSDQYALAATLWFALTGQILPDALTRSNWGRRGQATLPSVERNEVPAGVWYALERALHLDAARRFPNIRAFWQAVSDQKDPIEPPTPKEVSRPMPASNPPPLKRFLLALLRPSRHLVLTGHKDAITSLAFSPDGAWLLSGSFDRTVCLWRLPSEVPEKVFKGHKDTVLAVAFSADGQWMGAASGDGTVRVWRWDRQESSLLLPHPEAVLCLAPSPDSPHLATGSADERVRLFRWSDGQKVWESEPMKAFVNAIAFSPDRRWLAVGCADGTLRLVSSREGQEQRRLSETGFAITCLAFSPDGFWLVAGGEGMGVQMWQMPEGVFIRTLHPATPKGQSWVNTVAFSPNGLWLATGGMDEVIRIWRTTDGKLVRTLKGHKGWITALAFSPDGRWLASGSSDKTVRLWLWR